MKASLPTLFSMLLVAGCQQSVAAPRNDPAEHRDITKLLARMQSADATRDPVRRCLDYPSPPGVTWSKASIQARCELLAPREEFLDEGVAKLSTGEGGAILDAGFMALLDNPQPSPASKDGRVYRSLDEFSSAAALPHAERWLANRPKSPFAHAARGASLLAKAIRLRGTNFASDTDPDDLDNTATLATEAARELQQAYILEPRLAAACALRTTALQLSAGHDRAHEQGRACAHVHPESYFAASSWASAAEPRWGGSQAALSEIGTFLESHASRNPLLASIVGKIKAYDLLTSASTMSREEIERLQHYASYGPHAYMLNSISISWENLGEYDLSMAFLSSAIRFDIDGGNKYRFTRASMNNAVRPEWAVIDYRILQETYKSDPSIAMYLAQAEENVRNQTGRTFAREGSVTFEGDTLGKATYLSECLRMGTSDRAADRFMKNCSDTLVRQWPDEPAAWYVRTIVLQHNGMPEWKDAAARYLTMIEAMPNENRERIESIRNLLRQSNPLPDATGSASK